MNFKDVNFSSSEDFPPRSVPLLVKCVAWCSSGYQVCYWSGSRFYYDEQQNNIFHDEVTGWILINDN